MFVVDDAIAAAIRTAYIDLGVAAAVQELRRHVPGLDNDDEAQRWARTIAGWRSLPPEATDTGRRRPTRK